jgi:sec-independent protein translocase protein TatB
MFDIGFPELVLVAIVGLLVIGPERLPEALRTLGLWLGRMRRSFTAVKTEIEKEIGMDEVRRQLHNEAIMEEMKRIESEVRDTAADVRSSIDEGADAITATKAAASNSESNPDTSHHDAGSEAPVSPQASGNDATGDLTDSGTEPTRANNG